MRVSKSEIVMEKVIDESPDTSDLGRYSNQPGEDEKTIDRQARGDMRQREVRYFIAANSAKETGNPDSVEQDYQRMENLKRGEWCYIGITAKITLEIPCGDRGRAGQGRTVSREFTSPGLYGIESDSAENYFDEVYAEEKLQLIEMLKGLAGIELVD